MNKSTILFPSVFYLSCSNQFIQILKSCFIVSTPPIREATRSIMKNLPRSSLINTSQASIINCLQKYQIKDPRLIIPLHVMVLEGLTNQELEKPTRGNLGS